MVLAGSLCGFSLSWFVAFFLVRYVHLFIFLAQEGFENGGGVRGISSLYVLKAIMGKMGLSRKEAPVRHH